MSITLSLKKKEKEKRTSRWLHGMYGWESWAVRRLSTECFQIVVLEKTLESSLDWKEIKPVNLKRNQPWTLTRRTDAEIEDTILWPLDANSWLIGIDPNAGKIKNRRRREWQRMRWLDGIIGQWTWDWNNSGRQWRTGKLGVLQSLGLQRFRHEWTTEQQQFIT